MNTDCSAKRHFGYLATWFESDSSIFDRKYIPIATMRGTTGGRSLRRILWIWRNSKSISRLHVVFIYHPIMQTMLRGNLSKKKINDVRYWQGYNYLASSLEGLLQGYCRARLRGQLFQILFASTSRRRMIVSRKSTSLQFVIRSRIEAASQSRRKPLGMKEIGQFKKVIFGRP